MKEIVSFDTVTRDRWKATFVGPIPRWDGDEVETWRAVTLQRYTSELLETARRPTSEFEWLGPWLNLSAIRADLASWTRFYLEDAAIEGLLRICLRWAAGTLADTRKASTGTPVDSQVASYLCDADLLVTSDEVFVAIADRLHRHAPFPVAYSIQPESPARSGDVLVELLMS